MSDLIPKSKHNKFSKRNIGQAIDFLLFCGQPIAHGSSQDVRHANWWARKSPEKYITWKAMRRLKGREV